MALSERANELINLADIDYKAAIKLSENEIEFEFVIGFHLQQAAEKLLKAWLDILEQEYPKTHDLTLLLSLISAQDVNVERWWDLTLLMPYAVNLRYEDDMEHFPDMKILFGLVRELKLTVSKQ
jgi:HEPN domain-containing protein